MSGTDSAFAEKERTRLIGEMDRYLSALDARDIRGVPAAPDLRCTENTCSLPLGAGLWRTIRGRRPGGHYFVDVQSGDVEYWGVVTEMSTEVIFGVRLRVSGRLFSEIETIVVRVGPSDVNPVDLDAMMNAPAQFHDVIPPDERVPREQLIKVANLYFDAIELSDGSRLPVSDSCVRYVNGIVDSNMDPDELGKLDDLQKHRGQKVAAQMSAGDYFYIEQLRARRFLIVDEIRGLVLVHVMFDHPGDLSRVGREVPMPSPNSLLAFEVFKVRKGTLGAVWALGTILPYAIHPGWPA